MEAKVLYITRAYSDTAGGMERLSFELVASLKKVAQPITVLAHRGSRRTSPFFILKSIPAVLRLARRADVVHLGDPMLSFLGWLIQVLYHKPVVVTVHGLDITYPLFIYQWYLRLFFDRLNYFVAISHHVEQLLLARAVDRKVAVIFPGIFDTFYDKRQDRHDLDALLGTQTTGITVLGTIGRLVTRKGQAWFIEQVLPHLPSNVLYVVAGEGPGKAAIEAAVERTGAQTRVRLLGRITTKAKKTLLNTIDAFIQPNIPVPNDVEGFGIVLPEAGSCGRVVLAANLGGMSDAVINNVTGKLLPAGDVQAWIRAIEDLQQQTTFAPDAVRQATLNRYEWSRLMAQYQELYQTAAQR